MLFRRQSSRAKYADYLRRREEPGWSRMSGSEAAQAEAESARPGASGAKAAARLRRSRSFAELLRRFLGMLRGHRLTTCLALLTLTASTGIGLLMPTSTKITIDYILTDNPGPKGFPAWLGLPASMPADDRAHLLWLLAGAMIALTLVNVVIAHWGRLQVTRITKRLQARLRRTAFDHASQLPLHRVQAMKTGGVVSLLREDAGQAGELLFSMIYNPWRAIMQLVGTLVILAFVDWRMLLGAFLVIPITWMTHRTWIARIRPVYRDIKSTRTGIDAHATESFGGMRVVRAFGRTAGENARFTRANHFMARQELLSWWWSRMLEMVWAVLIPIASAGVLIYGGTAVLNGTLTIGSVMMFSTYLILLLGPLETLTSTAANIQSNLAALDRVLDLLAEPVEFAGARGSRQVSRATSSGRVTFENVSFSYPIPSRSPAGEGSPLARRVLHDISLDVQPGETVALVGVSGSGKTSLCNLVARFYDPTEGRVCLDGVDLREIDLGGYRRLLGVVEQDVFLFDGTVAENIGYARRGATAAQIRGAAHAANADEFIDRLEHAYETVIGERGVRLSGGQKQRLAIARAILADPLILILDEATSSLDSRSEGLIQRSLATLMRARTSFVIAHRLSTVRHADRIVVLDNGRIVETGSHEQLLERSGRYAELLRLQLEGHDLEDLAPGAARTGDA